MPETTILHRGNLTLSAHFYRSTASRGLATLISLAVLLCLPGCPDFSAGGADAGATDAAADGVSDTRSDASDASDVAAGADAARAADGGEGDVSDVAVVDVPVIPTTRVRIVAANLTSGKKQSWDPGHGKRILQGLAPDIALMQEFNVGNNNPGTVQAFVEATFGGGFSYYREPGKLIPNGVVSRYPILQSGSWEDTLNNNREFAWARIDVPGPKDLWAVSVHLLTSKSSTRGKEITQLVDYIKQHVPTGDLLVIGGDFNTNTFGEQSLQGLQGVVNTQRRPVDQAGNGHTNMKRNRPYDRVFADTDLEAMHVPVKLGANTFKDGLVFDTRAYTPLIDATPAEKGDSDATAMQHMAVVRDFALPTP